MFCDKCGSQIAWDSTYCSNCGVAVDSTKEVLSGQMKTGSSKADPAGRMQNASPMDDCIRPYMPKKHCEECGKELPGSNISAFCAMCTIRQRNRELEERRKNDDISYAARDRYDNSDAFDQSVFKQNSSQYYAGEGMDRFDRPEKKSASKRYEEPGSETQRRKTSLVILVVIVILIVLFMGIIPAVVNLMTTVSTPRREPAYPEAVISMEEEDADTELYDETPAFSQAELWRDYLIPVAQEELAAISTLDSLEYPEVISKIQDFSWDGIYLSLAGMVNFDAYEGAYAVPIGEEIPFNFTMCASEDTYLPLFLSLQLEGEEFVVYNRLNLLDHEGIIQTPVGAEFFQVEVGDPAPFPGMLIQPDALSVL